MSWSDLMAARDLPAGRIHSATVQGRALVVWRAASGALGALDAHCPHLGAHLGGGTLDGDTLVCPFHGWRFEPTGGCVDIGYPGTCPRSAGLAAWGIREDRGRIQVRPPSTPERFPQAPQPPRFPEGWYQLAPRAALPRPGALQLHRFGRSCRLERHDDGTLSARIGQQRAPVVDTGGLLLCWYGGQEPAWEPPPLADLGGPHRRRVHFSEEVNATLQDVAENPFDTAHLHTIHSLDLVAEPTLEEDGPVLHQRFDGIYAPAGMRWLRSVLQIRSRTWLRAWGLGMTIARIEVSPLFLTITIVGANTPIDTNRTEYNLTMVSEPSGALGRAAFPLTARQLWKETRPEREIWQQKRYAHRPHLTNSERCLGQFRRWSRRFPAR